MFVYMPHYREILSLKIEGAVPASAFVLYNDENGNWQDDGGF